MVGAGSAAGAQVAFERSGAGDPLVLLHPLGADRNVWRPVLELLCPLRDVVCVDLPGFGASPPLASDRPADPSALANAVVGLLARLGLDHGRAHLAGNSLGGWVALEVAAVGHAASVTAIAPAGLWSSSLQPKPQIARSLVRLAEPLIGPAMRSTALRRVALASVAAHPERIPADQAATLIRSYAGASGFAAVNRAMRAGRFTGLAEIGVPVTLAWPDRDRLVDRPRQTPANVENLVLAGCGHVPMWDDPRAVAAALLAGSEADLARPRPGRSPVSRRDHRPPPRRSGGGR